MNKTSWQLILWTALVCGCFKPVVAAETKAAFQANYAAIFSVKPARVSELQDLHWGMFICWSFSTFSGKEWTRGVTNLDLFAAKDYAPDQWGQVAKAAGMGYILFLTKHHDGFYLWDTLTTDRKVPRAPLGREVLARWDGKPTCEKIEQKKL